MKQWLKGHAPKMRILMLQWPCLSYREQAQSSSEHVSYISYTIIKKNPSKTNVQ